MSVQPLTAAQVFINPKTGQLSPVAVRFFDSLVTALNYVQTGTGTPEGVITASVGTLYLRTNGGASTTLYVKEAGIGNTGWIAK